MSAAFPCRFGASRSGRRPDLRIARDKPQNQIAHYGRRASASEDAKPHLGAFGRVVHGVLDEIADDVVQLGGIALDVPRLSDDVNGDPLILVLDRRRKIGCYRAEDLLDIAASGFEELLPRVEAREPQEILDQPLHSRRVSRDDLEELVRVFRIGRTIEQRLDISANGGEWCSKLVGDIGNEIAPDLISVDGVSSA